MYYNMIDVLKDACMLMIQVPKSVIKIITQKPASWVPENQDFILECMNVFYDLKLLFPLEV